MIQDEIKKIDQKINKGEAKPEEKLALLKEMNNLVDGIRADIAILKVAKTRSKIMTSLKSKSEE